MRNNVRYWTWRIKSYVPFFLLLIVSMVIPSVSAQAATIHIEPPSVTIAQIGQSTTVLVNVSNVQDYYGCDFWLFYDKAILSCTGVTVSGPGSIDDSLNLVAGTNRSTTINTNNNYNASHGRILFSDAFLYGGMTNPPGSFNGSGTVARVTFNGLATGVSALTLDPRSPHTVWTSITFPGPLLLQQYFEEPFGNGQITVIPEFSAAVAVSLLLLGTLAATLLGKKVWSKKSKDVLYAK